MEDHDLASARERMLAHADDPITGVCRYCARMLCPDYVRARASMAEAGLLDPLQAPRLPEIQAEYGQAWSWSQPWPTFPTELLPVLLEGLRRL